ncbi:MAG: phosphoglycerate kinase [Dehalococcoidia bacterium]|nr:phosphoglycerate kinase [Dehalococcoidia bacterium]
MKKRTIRDIDVAGKRVLLRVDYNVQVDHGAVVDDHRLRESVPTIQALRAAGACTAICSHRGRPNGVVMESLRNEPLARHLSGLLGVPVATARDCIGPEVDAAIRALRPGELLLLENVRFHAGEEKNDPGFARQLTAIADIYVNDAFGTAHRAHASIVGVSRLLPAVAGLLLEREVDYLTRVTVNPERPFAIVLGGAKMSEKLEILLHLCGLADVICIGGGIANTFLKAQGMDVQDSLVEDDKLDVAREILARVAARPGQQLLLPTDVVVSYGSPDSGNVMTVPATQVPSGWRILDIGVDTVEAFGRALRPVRTVVWNGPMGMFEHDRFAQGSLELARIFGWLRATTVVGGGETAAVVARAGVADRISHISTGGGASLAMLEGKPLPGVEALLDR